MPNLVVERHFDFAVGHVGRNAGSQHAACFFALQFHRIVAQTLDEDVVGILQNAHLFGGDVAEDSHSQAGTREWVTLDEVFGHTQLAAYAAHFVLEEQAQRFA